VSNAVAGLAAAGSSLARPEHRGNSCPLSERPTPTQAFLLDILVLGPSLRIPRRGSIQWFSLVFAEDSVRHEFLAALEDNPPAAVLLTNSQWPQPHGFDAADRWPKFAALLASRYVLDRSKNENGIA
jgi:hypothetical protein